MRSSGSDTSTAQPSPPRWPYLTVGGAFIAALCCWISVTLYFFRRYTLAAWIALATVAILLAYKVAVIGW